MLSEGKLHHLPLPSLASTCKRYLEAVTPFLDGAGYAAASRLTEEFMAGPGPFLHAQLEKIDGYDVASFVHRFWIESYLESRAPLAIFQNPACKCDPPRVFSAAPTLAGKIAQLIDRALAVHALIEQETLPPDRSGTRLWHARHDLCHGRNRCHADVSRPSRFPLSCADPSGRQA